MADRAGVDGDAPPAGKPLELDISLSVIDDLGTNLYSSIPAVLSEAVANAWDADAGEVRIAIDPVRGTIAVSDDGVGMTRADVQDKYLTVGYRRRADGGSRTAGERPAMGRKGIGKLSLFAIAETVGIVTRRAGEPAVGVRLHAPDIRKSARAGEKYFPGESAPPGETRRGTAITVSDLRVTPNALTEQALRKRIARRFSVIGREGFRVWVQDEEVTLEDRDDLPHLEYLWVAGDPDPDPRDLAGRAKKTFDLPPLAAPASANAIRGWLGTYPDQKAVATSEGDNQVAVLARGKVIHEDLLPSVKAAGFSARYLIGRIEADYLDEDGEEDIATSDRQSVKETDPRFASLLGWFQEAVRQVANDWNGEREGASLRTAMDEFPAIKAWHGGLDEDSRRFAKQMFGKIGRLNKADEETKCELYRNLIVAFERLRLRRHLNRIDNLPAGADLSILTALFRSVDEIEEVEYHHILEGRLSVIRKFQGLVDGNERERVLQEYLFDHLWLLDPAWERAAGSEYMERTVERALGVVVEGLSEEERAARIDIGYRTYAGKHVIVELKRAGEDIDATQLAGQLSKYRDALAKAVRERSGSEAVSREIEVVAVLGRDPIGYPGDRERQAGMLRAAANARWVTYGSLFDGAEKAYREYIEAHGRASDLYDLIQQIRPAGQ